MGYVSQAWFYLFVGPVMTKFTIALREIGTYKEVLRSQVLSHGLLGLDCKNV